MNSDAEQKIERLIGEYPTHSDKWLMLRDAMEFAYRDAARVCRDSLYDEYDPTEIAARNIEAKLK